MKYTKTTFLSTKTILEIPIVLALACSLLLLPLKAGHTQSSEIAIRVNQKTISLNQFNRMVSEQYKRVKQTRSGKTFKKSSLDGKELKNQIRERVIRNQVNRLLLESHAERSNVTAKDSEVNSRWNEIAKRVGSEEKLRKELSKAGKTPEDFRTKLRNKLTIKKYLRENTTRVSVTESELRSFYDEHKPRFRDLPFEKVRPHVRNALKQEKRRRERRRFIESLRQKSNVKVFV